jgi:flavin reductase (DIM6/NTAB) family NADH-FMN oxidoreductase RutF
MAAEKTATWEKQIQRNPHPDFKQVEASRPPFNPSTTFTYTQTPDPNWQFGSGANSTATTTTNPQNQSQDHATPEKKHILIDPHAPSRPPGLNYKLLISAIVPRPIAFLSTRSADGATTNLAPFSYFQLIAHDPPLFIIGFASALDAARAKDSLRNLHERKECVINIVSEHFVEAANSTSVNAPYGVSEWDVSGLTPVYDCETVGVARVKEAVFSIEGRLESVREFESRATPGKMSATLAVIEGTRFWAREDAVNEERSLIDPKVSFIWILFFRLLGGRGC